MTNTQITHLSLLRKYTGDIKKATAEELKAAQASIPEGTNAIGALFTACREYEKEIGDEAARMGKRPAMCFNQDGLCEDDHCRCWGDKTATAK